MEENDSQAAPAADGHKPKAGADSAAPEQIGSAAWIAKMEQLPQVDYPEALAAIKSGTALSNVRLPFLNLDGLKIEHDCLLDGCYVTGIVARGTEFSGRVVWRNCLFAERVQMSARKEEAEYIASHFHQGMQLEDCCFQDTFTLRTSEIAGEFVCQGCHIKLAGFDKSVFREKVQFIGPGHIGLCSFYQAKLLKGLRLEQYTFDGEARALDLNKAKLGGTLILNDCRLNQALECKRTKFDPEFENAWEVENSVLADVDIREAQFFGKVQFNQVKMPGRFFG